MKGAGRSVRGENARAVLIVLLSLLTLVSSQSTSVPEMSPAMSDYPSLTPISLVPGVSLAPSLSSNPSIGVPTISAPILVRSIPPNLIPPQPIPTEQVTPTTFPTEQVTPTEQATPTALPREVLTKAPTGQLVDVVGSVYITLFYVPDVIPEQYAAAYESECAAFFTEKLGSLSEPITSISCTMTEQEIVPNEVESDAKLRGRGLQANLTRLLTLMSVEGRISEAAGSPSDINLILQFAVLNDPEGFADSIREAPDSGLYFASVETVDAFDPDTFTSYPTLSPPIGQPEEGDSGVDVAGIVAIIIAIIVAVFIGSAVTYFAMSRRQRSTVVAASTEMKPESESESVETPVPPTAHVESTPPPIEKTHSIATEDEIPVTAAPSVMESEGGDALSYTYSLDAGNVESQVAESTLGGDQSTEVSSVRPNMTSREVVAPPGKLGIVIDTTLEGPIVHKVNPGSPLEDKVYPGDIIVAIDDVDTRAMSASAITALMVKTANQERRLTVLSEEGNATSSVS